MRAAERQRRKAKNRTLKPEGCGTQQGSKLTSPEFDGVVTGEEFSRN
jgi:hypothetical protein